MTPKGGLVKAKPVGQAYKDKSKPADVRSSNINAAKGNEFTKKCTIFHKNQQNLACLCVLIVKISFLDVLIKKSL